MCFFFSQKMVFIDWPNEKLPNQEFGMKTIHWKNSLSKLSFFLNQFEAWWQSNVITDSLVTYKRLSLGFNGFKVLDEFSEESHNRPKNDKSISGFTCFKCNKNARSHRVTNIKNHIFSHLRLNNLINVDQFSISGIIGIGK